MFAVVPSQLAPAGTTSLSYTPEASVPRQYLVAAPADDAPMNIAATANPLTVTKLTLRMRLLPAGRMNRRGDSHRRYSGATRRSGASDDSAQELLLPGEGRRRR